MRFGIVIMALYFVPASRVRAQTAPQDYFSAAITAGPLTGFDGDWVNSVPGASTGQIAATVAAFTYPYTSLYFDPEVGYNYCCGYFSGSGVATATANRPLVELHAKAGATALGDVEPGFGAVAHAVIGDTLYFSNVAEAETTGTFTIHIDGELTKSCRPGHGFRSAIRAVVCFGRRRGVQRTLPRPRRVFDRRHHSKCEWHNYISHMGSGQQSLGTYARR